MHLLQLRGDQRDSDENDEEMGLLYVAIARETRLTRLVFTDLPGYWEAPPRLRAMGCHAMAALQHLDVLTLAGLSADDCRYMGTLRQLTTLKLPPLGEVGSGPLWAYCSFGR